MSISPGINEEIRLEKDFNPASDFTAPTFAEWKAAAEAGLKGVTYEKALITRTYEGIDLQPIYTETDCQNLPFINAKPGFANYVRGTKPEGYLAHPWEICQPINFYNTKDFNNALVNDLERGQTAIFLALDTAAATGLNPDDANPGTVGDNGVSIATLADLAATLENIDLEKYTLHINTSFSSLEYLSGLVALLKKQNKPIAKLKGSIAADPLGFLAANGKLQVALENAYDRMAQACAWAASCTPHLKTISASGLAYHNAGANAVQELAFALATAVQYIDKMLERKLPIDVIAGRIEFSLAVGPFFFMETAKFRAARMLWANIIKAYGGNEESQKMTIHAVTSNYNQTIYDPYVNMLRTTTEAFSAVVGGVDSLQTNAFDELFGNPDDFSRRIARNTQIILKEESHLDQLIDPAGGAYFVEKLTADVAQKSWALFQTIESRGGMQKALAEGFPQTECETTANARKADLLKRKAIMVGTNSFADVKEKKLPARKPDLEKIAAERSLAVKKHRDSLSPADKATIKDALTRLGDPQGDDVVKAGAEALLAGATFGDLFATLPTGTTTEVKKLNLHRLAEPIESLRDAALCYETKTGAKPKVFLATMGPIAQHKPRADFSKGFFEVGGFDVLYPQGFNTPQEAAEAALQSGASVTVICSTDPTYPELVPPLTKGLKEKNPAMQVVLAGFPKEQVDAHKQAGVDEFIFLGADVYQILAGIMKKIGVCA